MKSIKPGRAPSLLSGVIGIIMVLFGIFWTVMASDFGGIMMVFGILRTLIALVITIFNFKNGTAKKRYSMYDTTDDKEEADPLNERFKEKKDDVKDDGNDSKYCPYCGAKVEKTYEYCNKCGKKLPRSEVFI